MIWSKKKHDVGEIKVTRRFALFPTDINDGNHTVVWLGWYYEKSQYQPLVYPNHPYAWVIVSRTLQPPITKESK